MRKYRIPDSTSDQLFLITNDHKIHIAQFSPSEHQFLITSTVNPEDIMVSVSMKTIDSVVLDQNIIHILFNGKLIFTVEP